MRRLWMVAAIVLLAGCKEERRGEVVGAERPGSAQQAPVTAVGVFVVDSEPNATARLLATVQQMNQAEIAEAQLAQEKATSEQIRSFARKLIDDHQRNLREISALGADKKLDVQGALNSDAVLRAKQQASTEHLEMLRGLSGEAFDAAFMSDQPQSHVLLVDIARQAQSVSNDKDIDVFFAALERDATAHRDQAKKALPAACGGQMQPDQDRAPNVIQPGGQGAPATQGTQGTQTGGQGPQGTQRGGQSTQGQQLQGQGAQSEPMGGTVGGHGTRGGEGALRGDQGQGAQMGGQGQQQRDQGTAPPSPQR